MEMKVKVKKYGTRDTIPAVNIWNQVVEEGIAFPQEEMLTEETGKTFFEEQSFTGIAYEEETGEIVGLYILHPNNIGRCGHICNASYAVRKDLRGNRIGEILVTHCLKTAKEMGFGIMQFNAVVRSNTHALSLYKKLGFVQLGIIPGGFRMKDGHYEDIIPHYYVLTDGGKTPASTGGEEQICISGGCQSFI